MSDQEPKSIEEIFDWMRENARAYSKAKAERVFLEHFRQSKLAILHEQRRKELSSMDEGKQKITETQLENWARSHPEYLEVLDGLRVAVETEERLGMIKAGIAHRVSVWQTEQANDRIERKGYAA